MGLAFADASTDQVDHASDTSLDDLTTISILAWVNAADIANAFRDVITKSSALTVFRRGVDGTRVGFLHTGTGNALVDIATGNMTAGRNFIAFTMEFAVSINAYWGNTTTAASDKSSGASVGSGSLTSDAGGSLHVGASSDGGANSAVPWTWEWIGIWNRVLTLNEILQQQYRRFPTTGCVLFSEYGFGGATTQIDWSGKGNNGTVTGATLANHGPFAPSWFHRPFDLHIPAAAAATLQPKYSQFLHWFPPVTK